MNGFLEYLPEIILYGVGAVFAFIGLLVVWILWGNYMSPATEGVSMGYYHVLGCYAGGRLHKEIKGLLVDATHLFITPEIEYNFRAAMKEDIQYVIDNRTLSDEEKSELQGLSEKLADFRFEGKYRVVVTREKLTKHVFFQWLHVDPISEYATIEEESKLLFGLGPVSKGTIIGWLVSLPQKWDLHKVGKCVVHAFLPARITSAIATANPGNNVSLEDVNPEWMPKLIPYMRSTVESKKMLEAVDDQLAQKDKTIEKYAEDLSIAQGRVDSYKQIMAGFGIEDIDIKELLEGRALDIFDFLILVIPTFLGSYVADYLGIDLLAGVFVGLFIGFVGVYRRRRRRIT